MLREIAITAAAAPAAFGAYAYVGYPIALSLLARRSRARDFTARPGWPSVTIVVPVHNEERVIADMLEHLLELDYPRDRLEILVVSDASTDATDDIVRRFADRGVSLLRTPSRRGKTAAENAAGQAVRTAIAVNIDASIRVPKHALRALVRAFDDPTVGVASGRDRTTGAAAEAANRGEGRYTGYEMYVRSLETNVHSIVGASGCFFATRRELYRMPFPEHLSRDFGSALVARRHGYRSVSVDDAVCFVPCASSLVVERRRKMRTMTRGIGTLWHMRALLDPTRYGVFAWMLFSHKVCRWLVPLSAPFALGGIATLAVLPDDDMLRVVARAAIGVAGILAALGWTGWRLSSRAATPRWLSMPTFFCASLVAGVQAWTQYFLGRQKPVWEPTRRTDTAPAAP